MGAEAGAMGSRLEILRGRWSGDKGWFSAGALASRRLARRRLAAEGYQANVGVFHTWGETPPGQPARRQRSGREPQLIARLSNALSPIHMNRTVSTTRAARIAAIGMCGTPGVSAARIPSDT